MRTKYRFRSRQEAEDAYVREMQNNLHFFRALAAMYENKLRLIGRCKTYRVYLFDEDATGPRVLVVFDPGGQLPHCCPYDAYDWASQTIQDYTRFVPGVNDTEGIFLRDTAYEVRRIITCSKA